MGAVSMPKPALASTKPRPPPLWKDSKQCHLVGFKEITHKPSKREDKVIIELQ